MDNEELKEIAKKEINYDVMVLVFGAGFTDTFVNYWLSGYEFAQKELKTNKDE